MRTLAITCACCLVALLAGCSGGTAEPAKSPSPAQKTVAPSAPAVAAEDSFLASGPLIAENQVESKAQREGVVARIYAETGAPARKGQLLAELDDRQAKADRNAVAARVQSLEYDVKGWEYETKVLEADLERAEKMWEAKLITQQDLDHARYKVQADKYETERYRFNLQSAREQLKAADLELAKTRVVAPFDGVVARRYVRAGEKVAVGDKLFWVTATSPLRIRFTAPERYLGRVKKGQKLALRAAGDNAPQHAARVIAVSPVIDPSTGFFEVIAEVVGKPADLYPGMTVIVRLPSPQ